MGLQMWSPETQLARFDRDFDETLDHFLGHDWGVASHREGHHAPAIESFIDQNQLVIRAELPGIDPKDVEITVEGSLLTIRASREAEVEHEARNFVHREIRYGSFARAISIPKGVRREDIVAAWRHGVLQLTIPLPAGAGVRRVPVEKAP
ncbi:MAG TPA: Hsp20/alpha crystallin family protein [Candidatus Binataceae bacterium]|nr:Hsp20/alpha crystallin family protein [Candidatus Binataceae bacterium]